MKYDPPEREAPRMNGTGLNQPSQLNTPRIPLWWLGLTAPIVAFLLIKIVEGIAGQLSVSLFYGIEGGVHWYLLCWFLLIVVVQFALGSGASMLTAQRVTWSHVVGWTILTSIEGVFLGFVTVWTLVFLAHSNFKR